jgi:hypothetical protein
MNKENKSNCKYCHLSGHVIDKCPTIICKHCKAVGHPNWLCKSNPNAENAPKSPNLRNKQSIYAFDSTNSLSKSQNFDSTNSLSKSQNFDSTNSLSLATNISSNHESNYKSQEVNKGKEEIKNIYVGFKEDFKKKDVEIQKNDILSGTNKVEEKIINLQYYQKMINSKWGDLIEHF